MTAASWLLVQVVVVIISIEWNLSVSLGSYYANLVFYFVSLPSSITSDCKLNHKLNAIIVLEVFKIRLLNGKNFLLLGDETHHLKER